MIAEKIPALKDLSPQDKLVLANELWGDFQDAPDQGELDKAIAQLLDKRFAKADPAQPLTWEQLKALVGKGK